MAARLAAWLISYSVRTVQYAVTGDLRNEACSRARRTDGRSVSIRPTPHFPSRFRTCIMYSISGIFIQIQIFHSILFFAFFAKFQLIARDRSMINQRETVYLLFQEISLKGQFLSFSFFLISQSNPSFVYSVWVFVLYAGRSADRLVSSSPL